MKKQICNVYGYPTFNKDVAKVFNSYNVILSVEKVFQLKKQEKITIVIDTFAKLRTCGIPILGYTESPIGLWVKCKFHKRDIVNNEVTITFPEYRRERNKKLGLEDKNLLLELNDSTNLKNMAKKYANRIENPESPDDKWLRFNLKSYLEVK
jgi:hypothetical protein